MCMQAANITDQDIDAIIQKGQRATEELNEKMKQYSDSAKAFTLDGGVAYEFKDEGDEPDEPINYKAIAGAPLCLCTLCPQVCAFCTPTLPHDENALLWRI